MALDPSHAFALIALPVNDNGPAMPAPLFVVTRRGPGALVKVYPLFRNRDDAAFVAQRAVEKHRGAVVTVEPVASRRRR